MFKQPSYHSIPQNVPKHTPKSIIYAKNNYSANHWAQHLPAVGDKNFIAILEINKVRIALKLNPTDARGYRAIAVLVTAEEKDMLSTFNRNYTMEEKLALNTALGILAEVYESHNLIAQTEIAGNNSQSLNEQGATQLGNEAEPSLLHGHIIGRGNPEVCYIGDVPLRGPRAGILFNMRGDGLEAGNQSKASWGEGEIEIVADALAAKLSKLLESSSVLKAVSMISLRLTPKILSNSIF